MRVKLRIGRSLVGTTIYDGYYRDKKDELMEMLIRDVKKDVNSMNEDEILMFIYMLYSARNNEQKGRHSQIVSKLLIKYLKSPTIMKERNSLKLLRLTGYYFKPYMTDNIVLFFNRYLKLDRFKILSPIDLVIY